MERFFITGTGTGVGKTLVTTALCWQLRQQGHKVAALKPLISGYDPDDGQSDTALILKSCGITPTRMAAEAISPWRYHLPLSPDMAAKKEEKPQVELEELVKFCRDFLLPPPLRVREGGAFPENSPIPLPQGEGEYLLAEGVGGVMSPINDRHTVLDWMASLGWPVIVVTGSYLGSISHTLTALEALHTKKLTVKALVISESESGVNLEDTAASIKKFLLKDIPVVKLPRLATQDEPWKHVPPVSGICL